MVTKLAIITISAGKSAAYIQDIIKNAEAGSTIKLSAGKYTFTEKVVIDRSDIKVIGAGVDKTNITVKTKGTDNATAFEVRGDGAVDSGNVLLASTKKGSTTTLTLKNLDGIKVGSIIELQQANDDAWFRKTGNDHLVGQTDLDPLREMLAKVTKIEGNKVTIASKTPYDFAADKTTVRVTEMVEKVELGGFTVTTDLGKADPFKFENTKPDYDGAVKQVATINVVSALGLDLHDIKVTNNASHGFSFSSIYEVSGDKLTTIGAHNKGGDGNGYAFLLKHAFNNTFTDLTDQDMRHSVLFGSWSAEHYNDIGISYTNRDVNFHGSPDDGNVIYVERSVLSYDSRYSHPGVSPGNPREHPNATIDKNDVKFVFFRGSGAQDHVYGANIGSDLSGGDDRDTLVGGSGKDRINGGADDDVLTGGKGADLFYFKRGFDRDTIKDFSVTSDKLDLTGTGVVSKSHLAIRQVGTSAVISLGGGDELVLNKVTASKLSSKNFTFSKAVSKGVSVELHGTDRGASGTNKNDTFKLSAGYLDDKLHIYGGAGTDSLQLIKSSGMDLRKFGKLDGIEVIDMTKTPGAGTLTISKKMAVQSDKGYLTVKVDSTGFKLATSDIKDWNLVRISGSGEVDLASTGAYVSAASGTKLNIDGGTGKDYVKGGSLADTIYGGSGDDVIEGGAGNDKLYGEGGNDRITGGLGADVLTGGAGADRFIFTSAKDSTISTSGRDTIEDFFRGQGDKIDVSAIDARADASGNQAFTFIAKENFSGTDGELRFAKSGSGTLVSGDINGDKKADFSIYVDLSVSFKEADFIL